MYEYAARIINVVDGDTVDVVVDLGLEISHTIRLRLADINAPEMRTPAGPPAKAHLKGLLPADGQVTIQTVKDHTEKYGRYLATILVGGTNINQQMVTDGQAVPFMVGQ